MPSHVLRIESSSPLMACWALGYRPGPALQHFPASFTLYKQFSSLFCTFSWPTSVLPRGLYSCCSPWLECPSPGSLQGWLLLSPQVWAWRSCPKDVFSDHLKGVSFSPISVHLGSRSISSVSFLALFKVCDYFINLFFHLKKLVFLFFGFFSMRMSASWGQDHINLIVCCIPKSAWSITALTDVWSTHNPLFILESRPQETSVHQESLGHTK